MHRFLLVCALLVGCGGETSGSSFDAGPDVTSDAADASDADTGTSSTGDPSCPKAPDAAEPSSWTALPGQPCTGETVQCFTYAILGGAFLKCCNGKWYRLGGDAGFSCP